nr:retrovirus-related Pol polyprotein from transposon TNT 1-94 [Tanacetum cinerariifolium]
MYKDTLNNYGADKSVKELQVEVELQRLNNHTPEEDQTDQEDDDDEDAEDQETDQTPDLTDYQLARDREPRTRTKPLRFRDESNMASYAFKASLVARGFTQRTGIDDNKVFSPVVRHTSIRVILALTACKDYELEKLDVKTAFLHGNPEEVIYMRQPPGYEQGNKVYFLKKSLYGLKQSPRQWYKRFDEYMLSNGFKRSSYDSCVYYRSYAPGVRHEGARGSKEDSWYGYRQGSESQDSEGVTIRVRDCALEMMSKVPYANAVGSLMYLMVCTRPDIAYAVLFIPTSEFPAKQPALHPHPFCHSCSYKTLPFNLL